MSIGAPGALGTGGGPSIQEVTQWHCFSNHTASNKYIFKNSIINMETCWNWKALCWQNNNNEIKNMDGVISSYLLLTCNRDKCTMFCSASFGNHANFVQAFIIFVEVRKSQFGESSASFNLHPFRIMQTSIWKWDKELQDPEFSVIFLHNSYICILHIV